MVITRYNIMHALLYFIVSLLSVAVIFYLYGAPFYGCPGSDRVCGRHHGADHIFCNDAEPGAADGRG